MIIKLVVFSLVVLAVVGIVNWMRRKFNTNRILNKEYELGLVDERYEKVVELKQEHKKTNYKKEKTEDFLKNN